MKVISDMLEHIFSIQWTMLPFYIAMVAIWIGVAYCAAMFLIGFPVSIWERFAKKKVNGEKEVRVIKAVTTILSIILIYAFLYGEIR